MFKKFNRKTDLEDHLYYYKQKMSFEMDDEALMFKDFLKSLTGTALFWFCSLELNSIHNFKELCAQFIT